MKKALILLMAAAMLTCAGCGSKPAAEEQTFASEDQMVIGAAELVETLAAKLPFDDEMTLVGADQAKDVYGILEEDGYSGDCALYISTMATPEEFAVFEADDKYSVEELTALAEARIEMQKESYADYAPAEMPKLDSAVIRTVGNTVILCVCADNDAAAAILDSFVK